MNINKNQNWRFNNLTGCKYLCNIKEKNNPNNPNNELPVYYAYGTIQFSLPVPGITPPFGNLMMTFKLIEDGSFNTLKIQDCTFEEVNNCFVKRPAFISFPFGKYVPEKISTIKSGPKYIYMLRDIGGYWPFGYNPGKDKTIIKCKENEEEGCAGLFITAFGLDNYENAQWVPGHGTGPERSKWVGGPTEMVMYANNPYYGIDLGWGWTKPFTVTAKPKN